MIPSVDVNHLSGGGVRAETDVAVVEVEVRAQKWRRVVKMLMEMESGHQKS